MPCGAGRAAPGEFLGIGEGGSKQRGSPTVAIGAMTLLKSAPKSFSILGAQIKTGRGAGGCVKGGEEARSGRPASPPAARRTA